MELDRDRIRVLGWAVAALLVAFLAIRALTAGAEAPGPVSVDSGAGTGPAAGAGGAPEGGSGSAAGGGGLAVQVAGEVRRPGVYQVPPGTRVHEAVARAGGLTSRADQAGVNLVAKLADGQQVIVPRRGAGGTGGAGTAAAPGGSAGPRVSLGSATLEQLDAIDGIGPTLARRIVEYRQRNGGFGSVEQLRQVDGIGEKRFESLRQAVTP